jgi:hypothetical protein
VFGMPSCCFENITFLEYWGAYTTSPSNLLASTLVGPRPEHSYHASRI